MLGRIASWGITRGSSRAGGRIPSSKALLAFMPDPRVADTGISRRFSMLPPGSLVIAGAGAWMVSVTCRPARAGTVQLQTQDELKRDAGYKAVDDHVQSGTTIGLGTGSTAYYAVERVGQKLKSGQLKDIVAIPTSERTKQQALQLGIPLATLDTHPHVDVAIDGADAVDPALNLVKGGGGAHFREKIVEAAAKKFIVIVDDSKLCRGLGPSFPVPVEIVPFCHEHTMRQLEKLPALVGCSAVLRVGSASNNKRDGDEPAVTDNGNYIVDLHFTQPIRDPVVAAYQLKRTVGVVEHGLFVGMASAAIIAGVDGVTVQLPPTQSKL